jgi:hypothetical protein
VLTNRHPGRPPGPTAARGRRPWDPSHLGPTDLAALDYVAAHPDEPRWQIAERFGISLSRLSTLTCSPLGQAYLKAAAQAGTRSV